MEQNTSHPRLSETTRGILLILGVVATIALAYKMRMAFGALTVSVALYYIFDPIANRFEKIRVRGRQVFPRLPAVLMAILIGALIFALFLLILIPPIVEQVERFTKHMPEYTQQAEDTLFMLQKRFKRLELPPEVQQSINAAIEQAASESSGIISGAVEKTTHFFKQIVLLFMIPFLTFYLLLEKEAVKQALVGVFPRRHQDEAGGALAQSSDALRGYIVGQLILGVIMGVGISVSLGFMGVKAPALLGLIAGVTKLIPVIGIFLGCIPAAFVALSSSVTTAVWVVIIFTVIQLLETKIILPLFLSRYVHLSPLTILVSIIIGEQLGGILGMFIATPVIAVLRIVYQRARLRYE